MLAIRIALFPFALALPILGCSDDGATPTSTAAHDAALTDSEAPPDVSPPDAGPPDAGPVDTRAPEPDAAEPDAAEPDAAEPDAGPPTSCTVDGSSVADGGSNPADFCQLCDLATSATAWTARPDGTTCGGGKVCSSGQCIQACFIDGAVVAVTAHQADGSCNVCSPLGGTAWSSLPDGADCGTGTCLAFQCIAAPTLSAVLPACGSNAGGGVVTLSGANFAGVSGVTFATLPATGVVVSNTEEVVATLPAAPGVTGAVDVSVKNAFGEPAIRGDLFAYYAPFVFASSTTLDTVEGPSDSAIADLNGDTLPDVVVFRGGEDGVLVLLATAAGTLAAPTQYATGAAITEGEVVDLNGDGSPDLVATTLLQEVRTWLGSANGTFTAGPTTTTAGALTHALAVGLLDSDAIPDIVVTYEQTTSASVLLGKGDGSFTLASALTVGDNPVDASLGDLNKDGELDLVTAGIHAGGVSVLLGVGDGTFGAATSYASGNQPTALNVVDLDADGNLDVVVAHQAAPGVAVLYGVGDGTLAAAIPYPVPLSAGLTTGDVNGDGNVDVVSNGAQGSLTVLSSSGGRALCPLAVQVPLTTLYLGGGDLDLDGRHDVLELVSSPPSLVTLRTKP